ncbi:MAG: hypothetical protein BM556_03275 [Bacteriovorax sp. MedPE-SWde]|nr:MAG: hypothetical protein BM556_03275 [Bacteriovorax sp. MedPE-SWde]
MKKLIIILMISVTTFNISAKQIPKDKLDTLFYLLRIESKWEGIIAKAVKRDMTNTPSLKLIEKDWFAHFKKFKDWKSSKAALYNFYSRHFTESEIDELIKVYRLPVIEKMGRFAPILQLEIKKVFRKQTPEEKKNLERILIKLEGKMKKQMEAKAKSKK